MKELLTSVTRAVRTRGVEMATGAGLVLLTTSSLGCASLPSETQTPSTQAATESFNPDEYKYKIIVRRDPSQAGDLTELILFTNLTPATDGIPGHVRVVGNVTCPFEINKDLTGFTKESQQRFYLIGAGCEENLTHYEITGALDVTIVSTRQSQQ